MLIGNATIDHLVLRPGKNSSPIHGIFDLQKLIANIDLILLILLLLFFFFFYFDK